MGSWASVSMTGVLVLFWLRARGQRRLRCLRIHSPDRQRVDRIAGGLKAGAEQLFLAADQVRRLRPFGLDLNLELCSRKAQLTVILPRFSGSSCRRRIWIREGFAPGPQTPVAVWR